jgi:hypothetical protein
VHDDHDDYPRPADCAPSHSNSPTPVESQGRTTSLDEPIVLEVDLQEPAVKWRRLLFLPYGSSEEDLGILDCSDCEQVLPKTMTVDEDGSVWIADSVKRRIVHYDPTGAYLGQVRFHGAQEVRDLETLGGDVIALIDDGTLVRFDTLGELERGTVRRGDQTVYLYDLYQAGARIFAYSFGTNVGQGLEGAVEVIDIDPGTLEAVSGLPVAGSTAVWVDLLGHGRNRWYRVAITEGDDDAILRRIQVVSAQAEGSSEMLVDVELEGVDLGRVVMSVDPLLPPWYNPASPGTWLVTLDAQADVLECERISQPNERRYLLVVDADGGVYRMIHRPTGVLIQRR